MTCQLESFHRVAPRRHFCYGAEQTGTGGLPFRDPTIPDPGSRCLCHPADPKGARIGEYVGERIRSPKGTGGTTMTRWSGITRSVHCLLPDGDRRGRGGNDTRFINHSCAPNCEAVIEDRRVFIDALRAIPVGSELLYDYAYERATDAGPEDEARIRVSAARRSAGARSSRRRRASVASEPRAGGPAGGSRSDPAGDPLGASRTIPFRAVPSLPTLMHYTTVVAAAGLCVAACAPHSQTTPAAPRP